MAALTLATTVNAADALPHLCVNGVANKQLMAATVLQDAGVGVYFLNTLPPTQDPTLSAVTPEQRILLDPMLCVQPACTASDTKAVKNARSELTGILLFNPGIYRNTEHIANIAAYFSTPSAQLHCEEGEKEDRTPGLPKPTLSYSLPFVIRGTADGLYYTRTQKEFAAQTSAAISYSDSTYPGLRQAKVVGVVGVPIAAPALKLGPDGYSELLPYVGVNWASSTSAGKATVTSTNTIDTGIGTAFYFPTHLATSSDGSSTILGNWLVARPDYLWNNLDRSRIASLNFTYTPVINAMLNDAIQLGPTDQRVASLSPILEIHSDNGWYVDRGVLHPSQNHDFNRLGVKLGFSASTDNINAPLTLTVTELLLAGIRGAPSSIDYLSSSLSWSFDPKKYFALAISYTDGRREDTAQKERILSVGLTAKY